MGQRGIETVSLPIWLELLVGIELTYLRLSPAFWGFGIPPGDGSAVVVLPGFLGTDFYLKTFRSWLRRIGYRPYKSSIGVNAECPNLLIQLRLRQTIEKAYGATGKKVHLVGHSLGGVIARAAAAQMPERVASVIALGSPLRRVVVHPWMWQAAEIIRKRILHRNGEHVMPDCYTADCTCEFVSSCNVNVPPGVLETCIYTKADGLVDWHCCMTGNPRVDFEVSSTHIGLALSPLVYELVARRLAAARVSAREVRGANRRRRAA